MSGPVQLQRETFELSRAMEFFGDEKWLTAQIGHNRYYWPVALLKELIDNSLDACEYANIAPALHVELQDDVLIVTDNGPGLPLATLEKSLNYTAYASDKIGYISPSRGQQGNALKTLWAAPFVATGTGLIEVETAEYRCAVEVTLDRIAQVPRLELRDSGTPDVKTGTKITVHWRGIAGYLADFNPPDFYSVVYSVTDFNPHCTLTAIGPRIHQTFPATAPDWQHWRPDRPTAPHWYTPERFRALVALLQDAEAVYAALAQAGSSGLAWREGTPADWTGERLLAAQEVLYHDRRMVFTDGRHYLRACAPPILDFAPDIPADTGQTPDSAESMRGEIAA